MAEESTGLAGAATAITAAAAPTTEEEEGEKEVTKEEEEEEEGEEEQKDDDDDDDEAAAPSKVLVIINTGGTFSCVRRPTGLEPPKPTDPEAEALEKAMKSVFAATTSQLQQPAYEGDVTLRLRATRTPIDSTDLAVGHWNEIARIIMDEYLDADTTTVGFVVIHGTDTLAYTAAALSFMINGVYAPIIVTGSQFPMLVSPAPAPEADEPDAAADAGAAAEAGAADDAAITADVGTMTDADQWPIDSMSDAPHNFAAAIASALYRSRKEFKRPGGKCKHTPLCAPQHAMALCGVHVVFNGRLLAGSTVNKVHSHARDAFQSPRSAADNGYIEGCEVFLNNHELPQTLNAGVYRVRHRGRRDMWKRPRFMDRNRRVLLRRCYPGMTYMDFFYLNSRGQRRAPDAVILEAYGAGNVPGLTTAAGRKNEITRFQDKAKAFAGGKKNRTMFVIVTECLGGRAHSEYAASVNPDSDDRVIVPGNITAEAALAKAHVLLGGQWDAQERKQLFLRSFTGEVGYRNEEEAKAAGE